MTIKTIKELSANELLQVIGELSVDAAEHTTEDDLLDLDEMLNELTIRSECDDKTRRWAEGILNGIGNRLSEGNYSQ